MQFQQTLVGRLRPARRSSPPTTSGMRGRKQPLAQDLLSGGKIARQHEVRTKFVGERRHGFNDLVDIEDVKVQVK